MPDRAVRFTESFFTRLEQLLPDERSVTGIPSITDFLLFDIPPCRDRLASGYVRTTLSTDHPLVRVYIGSGILVARFALYTVVSQEAIDVIWIDIDDFVKE